VPLSTAWKGLLFLIMSNSTAMAALPPLPPYTLSPLPPLIAPIPDKFLTLIFPIVAYWALSLFFHFLDVNDYLPQYRLHTPIELLQRNHVSKADVIRDVLIQQVIQTVIGVLLGMTEPEDVIGKEGYDVSVWATRIRLAQRLIPRVLSLVGLNATGMAKNVANSYPVLSGFLAGGEYPWLTHAVSHSSGDITVVPAFAAWEIGLAKVTYWVLVPALQFSLAVFFMDTWQYFLHRAMHSNLWLYRK
jgi:sphinganine C4-monooxygenase